MNNICQICEESVASGVMCDDGVYRCVGCAMEDGFDIQTGLPVEIAADVISDVLAGSLPVQLESRPTKCASDYRKARGVLPWKDGDELPEDMIRRSRGGR